MPTRRIDHRSSSQAVRREQPESQPLPEGNTSANTITRLENMMTHLMQKFMYTLKLIHCKLIARKKSYFKIKNYSLYDVQEPTNPKGKQNQLNLLNQISR